MTDTSELGERLAKKWAVESHHGINPHPRADSEDRETANWWLDAIAAEIEDYEWDHADVIAKWLRAASDD